MHAKILVAAVVVVASLAFASPPPSAFTRVVRPTTMHAVIVVQVDARLAVATFATARTLNAQQHP